MPNPSAKTHPPLRIPLAQSCVGILNERRRRERMGHGHAALDPRSTGLVFTSGEGAAPNRRYARGERKALCRHAGIRTIRTHDLRYGFIALLISTGTFLKVIEALLGHHYLPTSAAVTAGIRLEDLAQALEMLQPPEPIGAPIR